MITNTLISQIYLQKQINNTNFINLNFIIKYNFIFHTQMILTYIQGVMNNNIKEYDIHNNTRDKKAIT